jgi:outer membrane biosynthesis protein TonB
MDTEAPHDDQALRAGLRQARERLAGLERELRSVDAELEDLSGERQQYGLLHEVCGALEKLSELGAAGLFWGDRAASGAGEAHVRAVRGRVDAFQGLVSEIEGRRLAVVDSIRRAREDAEILEADLFEVQQEEERRKLEWVVEREMRPLPAREMVMAWSRGGEEDERFRRSLGIALLLSLLLGVLIPQIELPLPEPWEAIDVPDRLARLIREERPLPPPPPVREEPKLAEKEPEEVVAEPATPSPKEAPKPSPESKGILAFREKFSGLAESTAAARLGAQARISSSGEAPVGLPPRSMVVTQAAGSSGGINLAALSRDLGGGGGDRIEGVQVARATSSIGGAGASDRPLAGGPSLARTDEEIQIVFDRHKAALYRLYNRELRNDPTLKGQMVLRLTIEPDGSVSLCELQASDMKAPELSAQVLERVRTFDFGAKDGIPAITILYPIDFLPAT